MKLQSRCWLGLQSSEELIGQRRPKSKMSDTCSCQVGAGCLQEDVVSHYVDLSIGLLEYLPYIVFDL